MKAYELLYFVSPTIEDDARIATTTRIDTAITSQGGEVESVEEWGKRKLAYEIGKLTDGDYTLVRFHAEPTAIEEISRVLHIMDAVVRFMIVKRDDLK
jgi:small subunit ribosomal protein S6